MKINTIKSILSVAVLSTAGFATGAWAERFEETRVLSSVADTQSIKISYSAQDASSAEGRANLEARIEAAAREICGPDNLRLAGSLSAAAKNEACFEQAVAGAMNQLNAGQLAVVE